MIRWLKVVLIYGLAGFLFLLLNDYGVTLYKQRYGGFTARGVAAGSIVWLVFYTLIVFSTVIALLPRWKLKVLLNAAMVALILYWLLPDHPVRAGFFSCLAGGVTLLAIGLEQVFARRRPSVVRQNVDVSGQVNT
jgi:hypothetical protein